MVTHGFPISAPAQIVSHAPWPAAEPLVLHCAGHRPHVPWVVAVLSWLLHHSEWVPRNSTRELLYFLKPLSTKVSSHSLDCLKKNHHCIVSFIIYHCHIIDCSVSSVFQSSFIYRILCQKLLDRSRSGRHIGNLHQGWMPQYQSHGAKSPDNWIILWCMVRSSWCNESQ